MLITLFVSLNNCVTLHNENNLQRLVYNKWRETMPLFANYWM